MPNDNQQPKWKTRLVQGGFPDRDFDVEFWQEQGTQAIFDAAWEPIEMAEEVEYGREPTHRQGPKVDPGPYEILDA
jgi:hypothetical protein